MGREPRMGVVVWVLVGATLAASGCAGLPRIDPSGRRLLIWPDQQQAAAGVPPLGIPPAPGNSVAPPVGPGGTVTSTEAASAGRVCPLCPFGTGLGGRPCPLCPFCPGANGKPCPLCPFCGGGDATPAALAAAPAALAAAPTTTTAEKLSITPSRILAPIGSEVILRAGVCAPDGYLRTNRRVEWLLGAEGTGQFATVGERGELDMCRLPWERPTKHDNTYAVGYTSPFHTCLRRGTDDATDDVQVRPGEAWVTVTSASEGVSYVTAIAPESENWDERRATAAIYWVDAQWALPASGFAQPGQPYTLSTTVTRASDGAPIAGWVVRYEVLEGDSARLGYEAGQTGEATTDAAGRANIAVTPTDDQPGSARIRATVIRPAQPAPMASPRLELGGGESTVTWTPTALPGAAAPGAPRGPVDGVPPAPFEPPPGDRTPPVAPPTAGRPALEVTLRRDGDGPIRVSDVIPIVITVRNNGDAPASAIVVTDRFESGLSNAEDPQGRRSIDYRQMPTLGPGESDQVRLEFTAVAPGRQCHEVNVSAAGAEAVFERQCFDIQSAAPPPAPALRIDAVGEAQRAEGEVYTFRARVMNTGSAPADDVRVEVLYEQPALEPELASRGSTPLPNGLAWRFARIEPGDDGPRIEVQFRCRRRTPAAKVSVYATASGVAEQVRTVQVEITPPRPGGGAAADGASPAQPPPASPPQQPASPLVGTLSATNNPARVGGAGVLNVTLENRGAEPVRGVDFRVIFPPQVRPRASANQLPLGFRVVENALQFDTLAQVEPGQRIAVAIPYDAATQGEAAVLLEARSAGSAQLATASTVVRVEP